MAAQPSLDRIAWIASAAAFLMVSWHVAARAARDAIFLTEFDVARLPQVVIASSVLSMALVPVVSRLIATLSPARFVPAAFAVSSASMLGLSLIYTGSPAVVAILLYLLIAAMGAVLISGFWSVVNEVFDPRSAKLLVGRIGAAASAGGLAGGFATAQLAERVSVMVILVVLAVLHLACGLLVFQIGRAVRESPGVASEAADSTFGLSLMSQPYLRNLALVVVGATVSTVLIDYAFKAAAAETFQGEELMSFFAWFYTAMAAGTLLLQSTATRITLKKLGLGKSVGLQPGALAVGSALALLAPGLIGVAVAVAAASVVRNSVSRVGYELLYVPISRDVKRQVKPLIDVGFQRLADAGGGGLILAVIALDVGTEPVLLVIAAVLGASTLVLCLLLDKGYVETLEKSLLEHAGDVGDMLEGLQDSQTQHMLLRTLGTMRVSELDPSMSQVLMTGVTEIVPSPGQTAEIRATSSPRRSSDQLIDRIGALRSAALDQVSKALIEPLTPEHIPHVVSLLAWNEAAPFAAKALASAVPIHTGQLVDALLDPDQSFAVRRRVPGCLIRNGDQRAVDGLVMGLQDRRFEVRYRCGKALQAICARAPDLHLSQERIEAAILVATTVSRPVWESRSLLDTGETETLSPAGEVLKNRSSRSLDHVFALLGLILPAEPLRVAYHGLLTDDTALRGTALDYLENVLPAPVRKAIWPYLEPAEHTRSSAASAEEVVDRLLASHRSIQLNLAEIERRMGKREA